MCPPGPEGAQAAPLRAAQGTGAGATLEAARRFIRALLARKGRLPADFDDSTDFIAAGIIDSIGIIKFVLELESHFGIEIDATDMESPAFRSVGSLAALILAKVTA